MYSIYRKEKNKVKLYINSFGISLQLGKKGKLKLKWRMKKKGNVKSLYAIALYSPKESSNKEHNLK